MLRTTLILAALGIGLALAPAGAQTAPAAPDTTPLPPTTCSDGELAKMNAETAKMTDPDKKAAAMKEMTLASDMMAKRDMDACAAHLRNAIQMIPGRS
ncbi:hypothetical protein [Bosea sp. (in: a-proteobacteria)]|uniref:hypothetical protein n=1 Tax=Bosea sp. (in: a-proteobacteria) TaxID=1871050 RepID=UPI002735EE60|nr:hypothetical protein [Bosea sp. (in: a-proteobacteria)]MDP3256877.1 hypothetical protein [Bosea sp. (in: a-proteobacteria)]